MSGVNFLQNGTLPPDGRGSYASATKGQNASFKKFADIIEKAKKEPNKIEIRFQRSETLQIRLPNLQNT